MDLGNKTLNGILLAIAAENDLVGYNTYRNRKGRIIVKISYEEPSPQINQIDDNKGCSIFDCIGGWERICKIKCGGGVQGFEKSVKKMWGWGQKSRF